jgi:hypothetical protein
MSFYLANFIGFEAECLKKSINNRSTFKNIGNLVEIFRGFLTVISRI